MGPKRSPTDMTDHSESAKKTKYSYSTTDSVFMEVVKFREKHGNSVRIDWHAMVRNTSSGISNAREYQMIWRHLAYGKPLLEKIEDGAEPLDDDSDLDIEPTYMTTEPATKILSSTGSTSLAAASEESRAPSPDQSLNPSSTPQAPVGQPATPGGDMEDPGVAASFPDPHTSVPSDSAFTPYVVTSESKLFSRMREQNERFEREMQSMMSTNAAGPESTNFDTTHCSMPLDQLSQQTTTGSEQKNVQGANTEEEVDIESGTGRETPSGDADKLSTDSEQNSVQGASAEEEVDVDIVTGSETSSGPSSETSSGTGSETSSGTSSGDADKSLSESGDADKSSTDSEQNSVQGASAEEEVDVDIVTGSETSSGTGSETSSGDADKSLSESGGADKSSTDSEQNNVQGHASTEEEVDIESGTGRETPSGDADKSSPDSEQNNVQGASAEEEVDVEIVTGSETSSGTGSETSSGTTSGDADKSSSESGDADKSTTDSEQNNVQGHASTEEEVDVEIVTGSETSSGTGSKTSSGTSSTTSSGTTSGDADKSSSESGDADKLTTDSEQNKVQSHASTEEEVDVEIVTGSETSSGTGSETSSGDASTEEEVVK